MQQSVLKLLLKKNFLKKYFTFSLLITPLEVKTSRPSHGISHTSSDIGSDFFIGFEVVVGNLNARRDKE